MEKYQENLQNALKSIKIADHILYITYPIIKDKRLLLKSLDSIYDAIVDMINSFLQYDYIWKKIKLTGDSKDNFEIFINRSSKNHNISKEEIDELQDFFSLVESHKKAPMEFKRRDKIVIMNSNLHTTTIDSEKIKKYLSLARRLFEKARFMIKM